MALDELLALRHWLHAHPELSGHEEATAARIAAFLSPLAPTRLRTGIGGHGVLASFDSGVVGPSLLVRCELDALPIVERGEVPYRSTVEGVSHQCGHDGHMAMVCGLALHLADRPPARGSVHLLFQPAEETGAGAAAVLADPAFDDVRPDLGVAIHNFPGFPLHAAVVKEGTLTPAVRSIVLRFTGRTAHASEPHRGENPALAIADLLRAAASLSRPDPESPDFRLVTTVHVTVGSPAYGVSAGAGEAHFTLRAWSDDGVAEVQETLVATARALAERDGLGLGVETLEDFRANVNDPAVTARVAAAAAAAGLDVVVPPAPLPSGEDFGLFTARFPCCMLILGAGTDHAPVHNPSYDFPDELIGSGVRFYEALVAAL